VSWHRYLSSVDVPMMMPVAFDVAEVEGREVVSVELTVRCHETGEMITVKTSRPVQPLLMLTDDEAADIVRDLVRIALMHEIDEAITINGKRVFDPHRRMPR